MKISQFIVGLAITLSVNIAIAGGNTWGKASSQYTKCTDASSCRGKGGYAVEISQNDGTYLQLFYNGTQIHDKSWNSYHLPPAFEWRFHYENGKKVYHALIYRSKTKKRNDLNVIRLDREQSCYIGTIARSNNMNVKARQLADNTNAPCIGNGTTSPQVASKNTTDKPTTAYSITSWGKTGSEYIKNIWDKGCIEISSEIVEDEYESVTCKGKGNYIYKISVSLELFYNGKNVAFGGGGQEGTKIEKLEWRFHYENGKKVYHALIFPVSSLYPKVNNEGNITGYERTNRIDILRLDKEKSCRLDGGQNTVIKTKTKARQLADDKNAKCISYAKANTDSTDNSKDDENIPEVRKQVAKILTKEATCGGEILDIFPIQKGKYYAVYWFGDNACDGGNREYFTLSSFKYSETAKTFVLDKYDMLDIVSNIGRFSVEQIKHSYHHL